MYNPLLFFFSFLLWTVSCSVPFFLYCLVPSLLPVPQVSYCKQKTLQTERNLLSVLIKAVPLKLMTLPTYGLTYSLKLACMNMPKHIQVFGCESHASEATLYLLRMPWMQTLYFCEALSAGSIDNDIWDCLQELGESVLAHYVAVPVS